MRTGSWIIGVFAVSMALSGAALAQASGEDNPAHHAPSAAATLGPAPRMIVKLRSESSARVQAQAAGSAQSARASPDMVGRLAARRGLAIRESRSLSAGLHVMRVDPAYAGEPFAEQLAAMRADPDVELAEPDYRRFPHALPNDPLFTGEWYLQNVQPSAVNAQTAWDSSTGSSGVVIAVIDTGVLYSHPDLKRASAGGRLLPGYDFISDPATANDGDGRDSDATDAGDWITSAEDSAQNGPFQGCGASNSSWHGTRVSGIIGALSNNTEGITGSTWAPLILPIRALGKCGGLDSDIIDAMRWAAGLHVNGVPDNPYPAKVINMSLGSDGLPCGAYGSVIDELATRGVLAVISAGNESGPVASPANCPGVAAVTGLRHVGSKVGFASMGPEVTVGAPGGNCVNTSGGPCLFSIDTTYNLGTTTAGASGYTNQTNVNVGTSFSAPIVTGIVGLMASVNGNLGTAQLIGRLQEGAKPFPTPSTFTCPNADPVSGECNCTASTCGAGMANSANSVAAALRPIAAIAAPANTVGDQPVALDGSGSAGSCNRTIVSYAWSVASGPGTLTSTTTPTTSINAPTPGSGLTEVHLVVTDDVGQQDTGIIVISSSNAVRAPTTPATAGTNACPAAIAPPAPVTVAISPTTATVQASVGTQQFSPTVTGAQNTSVVWEVDGVQGGNTSVGTISATGLYTAPATVPGTGAMVTVTAVSLDDPAQSATAQVTITSPPVQPASPPSSGGGGGGGGLDLLLLLLGVTAASRFAPASRRPAPAARRATLAD